MNDLKKNLKKSKIEKNSIAEKTGKEKTGKDKTGHSRKDNSVNVLKSDRSDTTRHRGHTGQRTHDPEAGSRDNGHIKIIYIKNRKKSPEKTCQSS